MQTRDHQAHESLRLTVSQREQFLATGVLRLPGLLPRADAEAMAARLWTELETRHGLRRDRPETWTKERPAQFGALRKSDAFAAMGGPRMVALLDDFFAGQGWRQPDAWGQPLVTFPSGCDAWTVPAQAWHLDILPGEILTPWPNYVRVFAILAPLGPRGGGTVCLAGSHRLVLDVRGAMGLRRPVRSADVREALKRESPWIDGLCSADGAPDRVERLMGEGARVRGVPLRVVEMTGEPGDVYLMHPAILHAPSLNCRGAPRLMLVSSVYGGRYRAPGHPRD